MFFLTTVLYELDEDFLVDIFFTFSRLCRLDVFVLKIYGKDLIKLKYFCGFRH